MVYFKEKCTDILVMTKNTKKLFLLQPCCYGLRAVWGIFLKQKQAVAKAKVLRLTTVYSLQTVQANFEFYRISLKILYNFLDFLTPSTLVPLWRHCYYKGCFTPWPGTSFLDAPNEKSICTGSPFGMSSQRMYVRDIRIINFLIVM